MAEEGPSYNFIQCVASGLRRPVAKFKTGQIEKRVCPFTETE